VFNGRARIGVYSPVMPLYEYKCARCGEAFEALIRAGTVTTCPQCGSVDVERMLSMFAVSSDQTRSSSLKIAKQKARRVARDKAMADAEDVRNHRH